MSTFVKKTHRGNAKATVLTEFIRDTEIAIQIIAYILMDANEDNTIWEIVISSIEFSLFHRVFPVFQYASGEINRIDLGNHVTQKCRQSYVH